MGSGETRRILSELRSRALLNNGSLLSKCRVSIFRAKMSALPPKADMCSAFIHVCFGPKADIAPEVSELIFGHCRTISEMIQSRPNLFLGRSDAKAARNDRPLILWRYFPRSSTYSIYVFNG
jgi:hypothetical protein